MLSPSEISERIKKIAKIKHIAIGDMLNKCGLSKNALSSMVAGSFPKADNIAKLANYLQVPIDFLIGNGIFEDWEKILKHRKEVINNVSLIMSKLSVEILNNVDDITLAKLVDTFHVEIDEKHDGVGITLSTPIPVLPTNSSDIITDNMHDDETKVLKYYNRLNEDHKDLIKGEMVRLYEDEKSLNNMEFSDELAK